MYPIKLTFNLLPLVAVILSLAGFYVPGFQSWYGKLTKEWKQGFMLLTLFLISAVCAGLSVAGILSIYPASWQQAVWFSLVDFGIAAIANAGAYKATSDVNEAARDKLYRRRVRRDNRIDEPGRHG